jgi:hypothetical protein
VLPVLLGGRIHHQQVAVIEADGEGRLAAMARAKAQVAGNAEA